MTALRSFLNRGSGIEEGGAYGEAQFSVTLQSSGPIDLKRWTIVSLPASDYARELRRYRAVNRLASRKTNLP